MRRNRKFNISFLISVVISALVIALSVYYKPQFSARAEHVHEGYHYHEKAPTLTESGHKEFWACCKCQEQYVVQPATGNFVTQDDALMVGGLDATHIAYLPPITQGYRVERDFEELADGATFGGWTAVKDAGNTYLKATGSGWVTPVDTGLLYNDELALTDHWTMEADVYLVGNVPGNISFISNTFSTNNDLTFNKFLFWHTDENNGYIQVRKNATDTSDGDLMHDCGWLTSHAGFDASTIGEVAHNAWFNLRMVRDGNTVRLYANDISIGGGELVGLTSIKDVKFRICMSTADAEVRLDNFKMYKSAVTNNFESLELNEKFGGWVAKKEGANTYLEATNSGWVTPIQTSSLFANQFVTTDRWTMSMDIYLVGHKPGNLAFVSNSFSANDEGTFNKFFFWHTDENNGYIQVRKNTTDTSDGAIMLDCGWLTMHGYTDGNVGDAVHDNWVHVSMTRNGSTLTIVVGIATMCENAVLEGMTQLEDIAFRIAMGSSDATVRIDNFSFIGQ